MAGVVALLTVSACGGIEIEAPDISQAQQRTCQALVDHLPDRVADHPARETEGSPLGAAWGDPAIVLRCGVGTPEGFDEFSTCQRINDVDWFVPEEAMTDQDEDVVMTTIGRRPSIEVVVPADLRPPDAVMVDLAGVIKRRTKVLETCE